MLCSPWRAVVRIKMRKVHKVGEYCWDSSYLQKSVIITAFICTITYIEKRHFPLQFHVSSFKNALAESVELTSKFSITFQIYNEQI